MFTADLIQGIFDTAAGLMEDFSPSEGSLIDLADKATGLSDWLWSEWKERDIADLDVQTHGLDNRERQRTRTVYGINGGKKAVRPGYTPSPSKACGPCRWSLWRA